MSEQKIQSGGISFTGMLAIVFITLKLIGSITWSWLWVLAPIWIQGFIILVILAIVLICAAIIKIFD